MKYRYNGSVMDERMEVFLEMLCKEQPEYLKSISLQAQQEHVPVMRRQTGEILRFVINAHKSKSILEIGTAIGYSALCMSQENCVERIDTIEKVAARITEAKDNFCKYDKDKRIHLVEGDAAEVLDKLTAAEQLYDLVFMDAAKGQYPAFLTYIDKLLVKGGILVTDNVLQEGELLESRYAVNRRDRTIHSRMREFLYILTHSSDWNTIILPVGDGLSVSVRQ